MKLICCFFPRFFFITTLQYIIFLFCQICPFLRENKSHFNEKQQKGFFLKACVTVEIVKRTHLSKRLSHYQNTFIKKKIHKQIDSINNSVRKALT